MQKRGRVCNNYCAAAGECFCNTSRFNCALLSRAREYLQKWVCFLLMFLFFFRYRAAALTAPRAREYVHNPAHNGSDDTTRILFSRNGFLNTRRRCINVSISAAAAEAEAAAAGDLSLIIFIRARARARLSAFAAESFFFFFIFSFDPGLLVSY